jgi:hypothetical protein
MEIVGFREDFKDRGIAAMVDARRDGSWGEDRPGCQRLIACQLGALEIEAELPEGAPDNVVHTVTENAPTLRFKSAAFEPD